MRQATYDGLEDAARVAEVLNQGWEALRLGRTVLLSETAAHNPALSVAVAGWAECSSAAHPRLSSIV